DPIGDRAELIERADRGQALAQRRGDLAKALVEQAEDRATQAVRCLQEASLAPLLDPYCAALLAAFREPLLDSLRFDSIGPGQFHGFGLRGFLGAAQRSVLLRLAAVQEQVGFDAVDQEETLGLADPGSGDLAERFELEPRPAERTGLGEGGKGPGEGLRPGEQLLGRELREAEREIAEADDFLTGRLLDVDLPGRSGRTAAQEDD